MADLEFLVPPERQAAFAAFMRDQWNTEPRIVTASTGGETHKGSDDWMNLVRILLSIPGAVENLHKLNDRYQIVQKIRAMINWEKEQVKENLNRHILITLPDGRQIFLVDMDPADIIQMFPVD